MLLNIRLLLVVYQKRFNKLSQKQVTLGPVVLKKIKGGPSVERVHLYSTTVLVTRA